MMLRRLRLLTAQLALLLLVVLLASSRAAMAQDAAEAQPAPTPLTFPDCNNATLYQYSVCELVVDQAPYAPATAYTNDIEAYTMPDVKVVFQNTSPGGMTRIVHGFYDYKEGQIVFKVRFNASEVTTGSGVWRYTSNCTLQQPDATGSTTCKAGVKTLSGEFRVIGAPSTERGFLRRDEARTDRFVYDDGFHPFIWGQTYYNLINNALDTSVGGSWKTAINQSVLNYKLNKVRMLLFPFFGDYKYRDSQPFKADAPHNALNLTHWMGLDQVVNYLYQTKDSAGSRVLAELILFTDSSRRSFGSNVEEDDRYLRYVVARFGAFPNVVWCMANEWQFTIPTTDENYWNARAATLISNDPWMIGRTSAGLKQKRALSIHQKNLPLFQFYNQPWPSHAVLQFSLNHGLCNGKLCDNSDEWANFSIVNNRRSSTQLTINPKNIPVVNDEYGYYNSGLKGPAEPRADDPCPNGILTREIQRRGMWAIATAGGYGTFGDNSGSCNPRHLQPTISADWIGPLNGTDPVYLDIKNMFGFFNTIMPSTWWKMTNNNGRVSQVKLDPSRGLNPMRVYALEQPGEGTELRGNYMIYAVPAGPTGSAAKGQFKVMNLPKGDYYTAFYNPRTGVQTTPTLKQIKKVTTTQFATLSYDDWVMRIFPKPQPPKPNEAASDEYEIVWVGENLPAGANSGGGNEGWYWVDSDPTPVLDSYAHQSALLPGMHQHFFIGATDTLTVNAGDKLFAYVYLDPVNPPSEVMLQWNDGSWEHRAFWGADAITAFGTRYRAGDLPAAGQWVRLEVPASAVGLEGRVLNGMAFTLYGGQATWDDAGKTGQGVQATNLALGKPTTQSSTWGGLSSQLAVDGNTGGYVSHTELEAQSWWQVDLGGYNALDQVRVWNRTDCCSERLSNFYVFVSDEPFNSTDPNETQEQPGVSTYYVTGQGGTPSLVDVGRSGRYVRVQLSGSNYLSLAEVEVLGKSGSAATAQPLPALIINDTVMTEGNSGAVNAVFTVNLSAAAANPVSVNFSTSNGTATASVDYAPLSGTLTFSPGQTSKTLSVAVTGDAMVEGNETFFVNLSSPSNATIMDGQGQAIITNDDATPPPPTVSETVWIDEAVPAGAAAYADNDSWYWAGSNPPPFSGAVAHQSSNIGGRHQHFFSGATSRLTINTGDTLFTYIYLDPVSPPTEVMLQWYENDWEHRAYWGADQILEWGISGTPSRHYMGALPPSGRWIRLEVPASLVGLQGKTVSGMAFTLYGGRAAWDRAGKAAQPTNLAVGKAALQSSTVFSAVASRAADGNTSGNFGDVSVTHTDFNNQAWWQVDLGNIYTLDQVRVWNRTDCCSERLSNFYVFVSDEPFNSTDPNETQEQPGVSTYYVTGQGGTPSLVDVGRSGRYVRVQLSGSNYLSLAEVEVFGR